MVNANQQPVSFGSQTSDVYGTQRERVYGPQLPREYARKPVYLGQPQSQEFGSRLQSVVEAPQAYRPRVDAYETQQMYAKQQEMMAYSTQAPQAYSNQVSKDHQAYYKWDPKTPRRYDDQSTQMFNSPTSQIEHQEGVMQSSENRPEPSIVFDSKIREKFNESSPIDVDVSAAESQSGTEAVMRYCF